MKITDDKSRIERILKYIDYCIILHSLLIACDDGADHEWLYEEEDTSDVDDNTRAPTARDMLYRPIPKGSSKDERRTCLQRYFEHKEYISLNMYNRNIYFNPCFATHA